MQRRGRPVGSAEYTAPMARVDLQIVAGTPDDEPGAADFTLAHLADPHLSSLDGVRLPALLNKRFFGYLSWRRRRRREHRIEVLDALCADLRAQRPDHIAITGDLTHVGLPDEFRQAAEWLARLGPPRDISVVPGNHDAYVAEPWQATFAHWSDYLRGDGATIAASMDAAFPSLRVRGRIALIGLSTALPTAPLLATGRLGATQLQGLDRLLAQTADAGLFRVVLLHHPPAAHTVSWRKSLLDADALRAVVARRGAELLLHGHAHFSTAAWLDGAGGGVPALGAPSASALLDDPLHGARYHLCRIRGTAAGWRLSVAVRAFSAARDAFIADDGAPLCAALARPAMSVAAGAASTAGRV